MHTEVKTSLLMLLWMWGYLPYLLSKLFALKTASNSLPFVMLFVLPQISHYSSPLASRTIVIHGFYISQVNILFCKRLA